MKRIEFLPLGGAPILSGSEDAQHHYVAGGWIAAGIWRHLVDHNMPLDHHAAHAGMFVVARIPGGIASKAPDRRQNCPDATFGGCTSAGLGVPAPDIRDVGDCLRREAEFPQAYFRGRGIGSSFGVSQLSTQASTSSKGMAPSRLTEARASSISLASRAKRRRRSFGVSAASGWGWIALIG